MNDEQIKKDVQIGYLECEIRQHEKRISSALKELSCSLDLISKAIIAEPNETPEQPESPREPIFDPTTVWKFLNWIQNEWVDEGVQSKLSAKLGAVKRLLDAVDTHSKLAIELEKYCGESDEG